MNKIVLDVPAVLAPVATFWGKAARLWDMQLGRIEAAAKTKGLVVFMPRKSFYLAPDGHAFSFEKKPGYQYVQRKYYNAEKKKFVIWVEFR